MDRTMRCLRVKNVVNCKNKLYDKSTTNWMDLEGSSWSTCSQRLWLVDCRIGVVNKLDHRRRRQVVDIAIDSTRQNFLHPEFGTKFPREVPNFGDTQISLQHSAGWVEGSLHTKYQFDSSSHFDTMPACNRRTEGRHTHTRLTALCPGLPGWAGTTTTPAPHHSVFYRPDALPAAQPTASKHCSIITAVCFHIDTLCFCLEFCLPWSNWSCGLWPYLFV